MFDENKKVTVNLSEETSQWHSIDAKFTATRYPGSPLLDTNVDLNIPTFCITWNDKENLMKEIAKIIQRFMI